MAKNIHAIYMRVSSSMQVEGESLETQDKMATERIRSRHGKNAEIKKYVDGGFSGRNMNRNAFQELLRDIENNLIHTVYIFKLDRLGRNLKEQLIVYDDYFKATETNLVSLTQDFDTSTPTGRMAFQMLAMVAELESANTSERIKAIFSRFAKEGRPVPGNRPFGYKREGPMLVAKEPEATIVREIFNHLAAGRYNQHQLAKKYNLSSPTLSNMVRNRTYTGMLTHNGVWYKGKHVPLVTKEIFDLVQKNTPMRNHKKHTILFSGKLKCPCCGGIFYANSVPSKNVNGKLSRYYCKNTKSIGNNMATCTNKKILSEKKLEKYFLEQLDIVIGNAKITPPKQLRNKPTTNSLMKDTDKLEKQKERLVDLFVSGLIDKEVYVARLEEINRKIEQLKQKKELPEEKPVMLKKDLLKLQRLYVLANLEERKELILSLLDYIEILDGVPMKIKWQFIF